MHKHFMPSTKSALSLGSWWNNDLGPIVAAIWKKTMPWRISHLDWGYKSCGGCRRTIRKLYATSIGENAVHEAIAMKMLRSKGNFILQVGNFLNFLGSYKIKAAI